MNYISSIQTKINKRNLPKDWRLIQLDKICQPIRGVTFQSGESKYLPFEDSVACITTSGVQDKINWESRCFIPTKRLSSEQQVLRLGDIVVSTANSKALVGKSCVVSELPFPCTFGAFVTVLRVTSPDVDTTYLSHWFRSPDALAYFFEVSANTTNISNLKVTDILAIEIPLPPLDEQKRIAKRLNEELSAVESARKAAEDQLQAAWELPSAYLNEAMNKRSDKWIKAKLGDVCEITAPQVDPKIPEYGALPHVNGENIESGTLQLLYANTAAEDGMTSGKYLFETGDVLYSKLRPYLRKVYVPDFRGVCSADMYPIKVNHEKLEPHFLSWLLVSDDFTKYADEQSRRARMPKLNREQLFAWETFLPPVDEQKVISEKLNQKIFETKELQRIIESQLDEINALPSALLGRAFGGG